MGASDNEVYQTLKSLTLTDDQLREISDRMINAMKLGLDPKTKHESPLQMIPTYVRQLPTGREVGKFLALDLGGTNFRVLMITLDGNHENSQLQSKIYAIDKRQMVGPGEELFDYIAECLKSFIDTHELSKLVLPLGFTFSFPCAQEELTKAKLIRWTKGFKAAGVEGQDVVQLLQAALKRKGVTSIEVTAVLNDTTGTLMSCAFHAPTCEVGLILGTGTNACYMEKLDNVLTWKGPRTGSNQVIINVEWGAFGDNKELDFALTEFDKEIDNNSLNPTQQLYEKMISGMYLGEIVRVVLVSLINKGLLFGGELTATLSEQHSFPTKFVSDIENDLPSSCISFKRTKEILLEVGVINPSCDDCALVRNVCEGVSQRAAYLAAAGVAALIMKIGKPFITIGVDGSLYRYHPQFKKLMENKITKLIPTEQKFELMLSSDGSGRGAALVAAVAAKELRRRLSLGMSRYWEPAESE